MITNMLGTIGFIAAAASIGFFAVTFYYAFPSAPARITRSISIAYAILALTMLVLASAFFASDRGYVPIAILAADVMILIGTGYLLQGLLPKAAHPALIAVTTLIIGLLVGFRAYVFEPTAFIENGLLHLNLENEARFVLLGTFLVVWLPATVSAARRAVESVNLPHVKSLLSVGYVMTILSTVVFLSARHVSIIIISFTLFIACFFSLGLSNVVIAHLTSRHSDQKKKRKSHGHK